jgi:hypothetical protein
MGMAANPSGAHKAGRVFAGRIRLRRRVSVQRRRTLARLLGPVLTNLNKIAQARIYGQLWFLTREHVTTSPTQLRYL